LAILEQGESRSQHFAGEDDMHGSRRQGFGALAVDVVTPGLGARRGHGCRDEQAAPLGMTTFGQAASAAVLTRFIGARRKAKRLNKAHSRHATSGPTPLMVLRRLTNIAVGGSAQLSAASCRSIPLSSAATALNRSPFSPERAGNSAKLWVSAWRVRTSTARRSSRVTRRSHHAVGGT
jgi:hypothetical protein